MTNTGDDERPEDIPQGKASCSDDDRENARKGSEGTHRKSREERRAPHRTRGKRSSSQTTIDKDFSFFLRGLAMLFFGYKDPTLEAWRKRHAKKHRNRACAPEKSRVEEKQTSTRPEKAPTHGENAKKTSGERGKPISTSTSRANKNKESNQREDGGEESLLSKSVSRSPKKRRRRRRQQRRYNPARSVRNFFHYKKQPGNVPPAYDHSESRRASSIPPVPWYRQESPQPSHGACYRAPERGVPAEKRVPEKNVAEPPVVPQRLTRWPGMRNNKDRCEAWIEDCWNGRPAQPLRSSRHRPRISRTTTAEYKREHQSSGWPLASARTRKFSAGTQWPRASTRFQAGV